MTTPAELKKDSTKIIKEKSKIENKEAIKDSAKINKDLSSYNAEKVLEVNSEVTTNTPSETRNISYQILTEPLKAISPESIINAVIAGVTTISQGLLEQIPTKVKKVSELSQNPDAANNSQITDCVKSANNKCSTIAKTEMFNAQLANGHELRATFASQTIAANSIRFSSDTTISQFSPYVATTTQDYHVQSNNSLVFVSDIKLGNYKQELNLVEGSSITQAQTGLSVYTETSDTVSKNTRSIGIDTHSTLGKENNIIADSKLTSVSGGDIQTAAYGNIGIQGNGDIAIVAAKSDNPANVAASGEEELSIPFNYGGKIYFISKTSADFTNLFGLTEKGIFSSTSGNSVNSSSGYNVVSGNKGTSITSDKFAYVGTTQGGMFIRGRKMFLGSMVIPLTEFTQPNVIQIPGLPNFPTLPSQSLENCIPKNTNSQEENDEDLFGDLEDIYFDDENSEVNNSNINIKPDIRKVLLNNKKQQAKLSSISSSSTNQNFNKLPPPSSVNNTNQKSSLSGNVAAIDATGVLGGPPGVYVSSYNTDTVTNSLDLISSQEAYTVNSLLEYLYTDDVNELAALALSSPEDFFTVENITSQISNIIPSELISEMTYPLFYLDLLNVSLSKLESFTITIEDFLISDKAKAASMLIIIQQYPALKEAIKELIQEATAVEAIGFLGFLSNIAPTLNLGLVKDIVNIPKLIQQENPLELFNTIKPYASKLLKGTPFKDLLNSPDLLQLGETLIKGDPKETETFIKTKIDSIYNNKIKQILENRLSSILGPQFQSLIPAFKDILNKVKIGESINPNDYISQITEILDSVLRDNTASTALSLYKDFESLLKSAETGDVFSIITGSNLNNILSTVLGAETAGSISKVIDLAKEAVGTYEAIKLLPDVLSLLNDFSIPSINQVANALNCLDLFNKVKSLLSGFSSLGESNKSATNFLENTGRLIQGANSINSLEDSDLLELNNNLVSSEVDLLDLKPFLNFNLNLNLCFNLPKLTLFQSQIDILEINDGDLIFSLTNFNAIKNTISMLPKVNGILQIRVKGFIYNSKDYLNLYQTDFQYTPSVYSFIITEYNNKLNKGIAVFDRAVSSIILENFEGILYEFSSTSIGISLLPDIIDSYLLA